MIRPLSYLRNKLTTQPRLAPVYWEQAAENRKQFTPDLLNLSTKDKHWAFIYDDAKTFFPFNEILDNPEHSIPSCLTRDAEFSVVNKRYKQVATALAFKPKPVINAMRYNPLDPARIRGELHLLNTETYYRLDRFMANGVYCQRERITVQLPWDKDGWIKLRGMWMPNEYPNTIRAWSYFTTEEALQDEPYYSLSATSKFFPKQRERNSRYINSKPYYEFTRRDLNGV